MSKGRREEKRRKQREGEAVGLALHFSSLAYLWMNVSPEVSVLWITKNHIALDLCKNYMGKKVYSTFEKKEGNHKGPRLFPISIWRPESELEKEVKLTLRVV